MMERKTAKLFRSDRKSPPESKKWRVRKKTFWGAIWAPEKRDIGPCHTPCSVQAEVSEEVLENLHAEEPILPFLWEPEETIRAWSGNVHLALLDTLQDQCSVFPFTPVSCRCFRTILACLWAAPRFLQLRIIIGFQKVSQEGIRPWFLADVDQDISAETCRDWQPGTMRSRLSLPVPHSFSSCSVENFQDLNTVLEGEETQHWSRDVSATQQNRGFVIKVLGNRSHLNKATFLVHPSLEIEISKPVMQQKFLWYIYDYCFPSLICNISIAKDSHSISPGQRCNYNSEREFEMIHLWDIAA